MDDGNQVSWVETITDINIYDIVIFHILEPNSTSKYTN